MTTLRKRTIGIGAVIAALVAAVGIALAITAPHLGAVTRRAAVSVSTTERLAAGPYVLSIARTAAPGGERADVTVTDQSGAIVAGKPVTGLLVYEGSAAGHEHHDILVSQEPEPGHYVLDLREAISGPWLLTLVIDSDARVAYVFNVR